VVVSGLTIFNGDGWMIDSIIEAAITDSASWSLGGGAHKVCLS
jgi:hypothetical protein